MDSLRLEVYARSLFRSFSPVHLLGVQNLTIFTGLRYFDWAHHFREGWDSYWFETPYFDHDQPEYQTIGTLLHYVKPRYLSSVVHLKFDGNRIIEVGQFRQDMRGSLRPLFFRYRNGEGGVRIVPIKLSQRLKWWNTEFGWRHLVGFEIFFLGPREAVRFQDEAVSAANHRVWLDFVSIYLWHALKPERLLEADGVTSFRTDPQGSFLF